MFFTRCGFTACVPMLPISSAYPSGGDFATRSAPILPPAPALFSTTTGWPHASETFCAMTRAKVSAMPPTANGTTILMGLEGYACASAPAENASDAPAATRRSHVFMVRMVGQKVGRRDPSAGVAHRAPAKRRAALSGPGFADEAAVHQPARVVARSAVAIEGGEMY